MCDPALAVHETHSYFSSPAPQAARELTFWPNEPRRLTVRLDDREGSAAGFVPLADAFAAMDLDADLDPGPPMLVCAGPGLVE